MARGDSAKRVTYAATSPCDSVHPINPLFGVIMRTDNSKRFAVQCWLKLTDELASELDTLGIDAFGHLEPSRENDCWFTLPFFFRELTF